MDNAIQITQPKLRYLNLLSDATPDGTVSTMLVFRTLEMAITSITPNKTIAVVIKSLIQKRH